MSNKALITFILFLLFVIFIGVVVLTALPNLIAASTNVWYLTGMLMVLAFICYGINYFWKKIKK